MVSLQRGVQLRRDAEHLTEPIDLQRRRSWFARFHPSSRFMGTTVPPSDSKPLNFPDDGGA
jgi:hypothetical protein